MSVEVVEGPDGLYVITGDPGLGYDVRPVGPPVASYERKFVARRAIRDGSHRAVQEDTP